MTDQLDAALEDESKRRQEVNRGQRARNILEDDLFVQAVDAIKQRVWEDFARSKLNDDKRRTLARLKLDCLNDLLGDLKRHMETGKIASEQLPSIERLIASLRRS